MSLFKREQQEEATPKNLVKKVQQLEGKLEKATKEIAELKEKMQHTVTNIGVTRFNPFQEIGGNQSFSVALLDENKNGLVVTSYYGRELNRVYAKEIQGGTSAHELSTEEKEAIKKAMYGKSK